MLLALHFYALYPFTVNRSFGTSALYKFLLEAKFQSLLCRGNIRLKSDFFDVTERIKYFKQIKIKN